MDETMYLPRIEALDLRPPMVIENLTSIEWDFPKFPRRVAFFISTGHDPIIRLNWSNWKCSADVFNRNVVIFSPVMEDWSVHYIWTPKRRVSRWWIVYIACVLGILIADYVMAKAQGWL